MLNKIKIYDIAIIGSGPAGSLLSILLSKQGYKIIIIDKRNLDSNPPIRQKTCGGLLSPDAQRVLASLDFNLLNDVLANPQLFSVNTIDLNTNKSRNHQRFYLNMDREKFDRYLSSVIPNSVNKSYSTIVNRIEYIDNLYKIHANLNEVYYSKVLIGCDGAGSIVRKSFFQQEKFPVKKYFAIQYVYKWNNLSSKYYAIFDKTLTDYSGWAFPKNDKFTVGMAFPDKSDGIKFFNILIDKLKKYGLPLDDLISTEGSLLLRPDGFVRTYSKNNNTVFLAGEAAGYISPSSAEGFSFAFNSACALSESFEKGGNISKNYKIKTIKLRTKIFIKVIKAHLLYNQFIRKTIMALKINAIK